MIMGVSAIGTPLAFIDSQIYEVHMRILIIDDDPLSLSGLKMMLEQQGGHECTSFQNPVEAVAQYQPEKYDAVITDIRMPEMSGLEVKRRILAINPNAPVILISGHEVQPEEQKEVGCCLCRFFSKPLRAVPLLEALQKAVASKDNNNRTE